MNYVLSKRKPEIGDRGFIIGNRFIPVYKQKVKIPEEGLVYYAPFNEWTGRAETGQQMNRNSSSDVFISTYQKRTGIEIKSSSHAGHKTYIQMNDISNVPGSKNIFSVSMQFYCVNSGNSCLLSYGQNDVYDGISIVVYQNKICIGKNLNDIDGAVVQGQTVNLGKWYTVCVLRRNDPEDIFSLYLDGQLLGSASASYCSIVHASGYTGIGGRESGNWVRTYGDVCIRQFRIYNRVLTDKQIKALSKES